MRFLVQCLHHAGVASVTSSFVACCVILSLRQVVLTLCDRSCLSLGWIPNLSPVNSTETLPTASDGLHALEAKLPPINIGRRPVHKVLHMQVETALDDDQVRELNLKLVSQHVAKGGHRQHIRQDLLDRKTEGLECWVKHAVMTRFFMTGDSFQLYKTNV